VHDIHHVVQVPSWVLLLLCGVLDVPSCKFLNVGEAGDCLPLLAVYNISLKLTHKRECNLIFVVLVVDIETSLQPFKAFKIDAD